MGGDVGELLHFFVLSFQSCCFRFDTFQFLLPVDILKDTVPNGAAIGPAFRFGISAEPTQAAVGHFYPILFFEWHQVAGGALNILQHAFPVFLYDDGKAEMRVLLNSRWAQARVELCNALADERDVGIAMLIQFVLINGTRDIFREFLKFLDLIFSVADVPHYQNGLFEFWLEDAPAFHPYLFSAWSPQAVFER